MSLSISLRDVASSWGDTGKIQAAVVVGTVAGVATDCLIRKAFDSFNIPFRFWDDLEGLTLDQIGERHREVNRNLKILQIAMSVMMVVAPAYLPIKFASFNLKQIVQLVILDALVYGVVRQVFRGNHIVESKGVRFLILSRMLMGAIFAKLGSHSKLIVPVLGAVNTYVSEHQRLNAHPIFLRDLIVNVFYAGERWARQSVHDV